MINNSASGREFKQNVTPIKMLAIVDFYSDKNICLAIRVSDLYVCCFRHLSYYLSSPPLRESYDIQTCPLSVLVVSRRNLFLSTRLNVFEVKQCAMEVLLRQTSLRQISHTPSKSDVLRYRSIYELAFGGSHAYAAVHLVRNWAPDAIAKIRQWINWR